MKEELIGNQKRERGISTLEVLIALAIFAISISAVIAVSFNNQSLSVDAQYHNQALYLAKENMEKTRVEARQNFNAVVSTSTNDGVYLKEIIIEDLDAYKKKIISRVGWQIESLRPQKVELATILTDWKNAVPPDSGDSGGSGVSGDWKNPKTLGSVDLGPGNSATDLDVINKIVYLTAEASAHAKPDFYVVDATDGQNPRIISSLHTGDSLNAVDASGNYAYVANKDDDAQLQIIDVNNRSNPTLVASFDLPGVSGSGAIGQSMFYADSKVYVGTKKASGPEFHVIDVSNPNSPVALGSFEINGAVNMIYVKNNIAYIAFAGDNYELKILDVSNPAAITELNKFNAPGDSEDGKSVYLSGNKLYLGRILGGNHANHHEFHILDVGSSTSPQNLGSKDLGADLNDLKIRDNLAFLGTGDSNKEFQVWDVSDPANPTLWSYFNFPQVATGIDYESNIVYISVRSNDALRIITSQ
jgi:hypothetical protein